VVIGRYFFFLFFKEKPGDVSVSVVSYKYQIHDLSYTPAKKKKWNKAD